jgi:hypothetical protein
MIHELRPVQRPGVRRGQAAPACNSIYPGPAPGDRGAVRPIVVAGHGHPGTQAVRASAEQLVSGPSCRAGVSRLFGRVGPGSVSWDVCTGLRIVYLATVMDDMECSTVSDDPKRSGDGFRGAACCSERSSD